MDLSVLDASSEVVPLLVRLHDSHEIYAISKHKDPEARAQLTDAVCELLDQDVSEREAVLIADILIALVHQAEKDLRLAIAERLSGLENVPLRLILHLANDDIEIATPVLKHSQILNDQDLTYFIKSKEPKYWQAIATRAELSDKVIDTLAETQDFDTAVALAENEQITLTQNAVTVLSDLAQESDALALPLLRREEVPQEVAARLYHFVGEEIKEYIQAHYDPDQEKTLAVADQVIEEFTGENKSADEADEPGESMVEAAERMNLSGELKPAMMISTLRRGQFDNFVAQFAAYTKLPLKTVEDILAQPNGQGLAVACRAFAMSKSDFVSIFLLTNEKRSNERIVDLKNMGRAIEYYDRLKEDVARDLLEEH